MSENTNTPTPEIVYESISDTTQKTNKLKYERIKVLCSEAQTIRSLLHQTQSQDVIERLEAFIQELNTLKKSSSKYLDTEEVMSDMEWIIEYKHTNEWLYVTRWLSNLDSSLREMWSNYIEKVIAHKNQQSTIQLKKSINNDDEN